MGKRLHVLVVEDSEDDTLLNIEELRRGGYEPTFERVETHEAVEAALNKGGWDVIISDYKMPHFSVPAALKLVREKKIDVPFIVVSGAVGEDIAVEMMKEGAHDYLLKGNLTRLAAVIEREIREAENRAERKKMEKETKKHLCDLEVFYKANISREERIRELKEEIRKLKAKIEGISK